MSKISTILNQSEGRRLEFKVTLPSRSDLSKTAIAFANDAGGEIYIGIKDNPREVVGLNSDELLTIEEKVSSLIHDLCNPTILPEISFLQHEGKHIIRVQIFKGSTPPYHLKSRNIEDGTFIRVGSTNRQASVEMINELSRQQNNISYDSELVYSATVNQLDLSSFREQFKEKTGEKLNENILRKLELLKEIQGQELPTNALVLLSDSQLKRQLFPYVKIECARF